MASRLSSAFKDWRSEGPNVLGPGRLAVRVEDLHRLGPQHIDIGFVLNREDDRVPVIWDCAAGVGATDEQIFNCANDTWMRSTFPVLLELLKQDGSEAPHFNEGVPGCCPRVACHPWPFLAYGRGDAPKALQAWALDSELLAKVGPVAAKSLTRPMLNGAKLLFGFADDNVAEVRINGIRDEAASRELAPQKWASIATACLRQMFLALCA